MGANFDYFKIKTDNRQRVKEVYVTECQDAAYEDGNSYSGRINMSSGLEFHDKIFDSLQDAEDYVQQNAEKWGNAIAVQYKRLDELWFFVGAICSS